MTIKKELKTFKRDVDKIQASLDLKKLMPGYFNPWVFRLSIVAMLFLFVFTAWSNDWHLRFNYVVCPEDSARPCAYDNNTGDYFGYSDYNIVYLQPGETLGQAPNDHALAFNNRVLSLAFFAFVLNHIVYAIRYKTLIYRRGLHES